MTEKVALVTASSAGLGAAAAKALASVGFRVVINYHSSKDKADVLVAEVCRMRSEEAPASTAPRCVAVKADMTRRHDIEMLVQETVDTMGRLDVVVSNQGWTRIRQFDDLNDNMDESDWNTCFDVNVKSHLYLFHSARPHLKATNGAFISVASLAGVVPSGSSIPYSVTKAAQIHLIKALAKISGPDIRVNSISPGILLTEWGKQFPEEKLMAAREKSVLKRLADIKDAAQQIVLFATSRSHTGQNAVIDAGWSSA